VKGYRRLRGLNEAWLEFVLSASAGDLDRVVTNSGWVLGSSNENNARMSYYRQRAKELSKGAVELQLPCAIYFLEAERGSYKVNNAITLSSNGVDAFFTSDFH